MSLGVALGWHALPFDALVDSARLAESLGYEALFVDGDVSMLPSRGEGEVLDGWTVTTALLARTERIGVGSIRLVNHWNAARLAQSLSTAERLFPGRIRFLAGVGGHQTDRSFGLAFPAAGARLRWLDETLGAVRRLLGGEAVSFRGEFVELDQARVRPTPARRIPIEVAAARPRMLDLVARHADRWDVNLPPLSDAVEGAAAHLAKACASAGRDPSEISRSMWLFTRVGDPDDPTIRAAYRRFNPWFDGVPDARLGEAIVAGDAEACRARVDEIRDRLGIDLPVLDLSGLDADATRRVMQALAPRAILRNR